MKTAVVTLVFGAFHQRMAQITQPTIQAYANKLDADWIVWDEFQGHSVPQYKKLDLGRLLDDYDRVLFIDNDILVREDAPDVFALVPEDELGILEETRYIDRTIEMTQFMLAAGYDPESWNRKYYNTGVMVLSKRHQGIFAQPAVEWDHYKEQSYLNVMISRTKTKVFALPHRFNRMLTMDKYHGEERHDCYFLHYAGAYLYLNEDDRLKMMLNDLAVWRRAAGEYHFRKNIAIHVDGELCNQVAAEPTIRYARDVVYQGDNLVVISAWPGVFRHLQLPVYNQLELVPSSTKFLVRHTLGDPSDTPDHRLSRHHVHAVDLASLNALCIELPLNYKTPLLAVDAQAKESLAAKLGSVEVSQLVLMHPGKGEPLQTVPAEFWQSHADTLIEHGYRVAVIGTRNSQGMDTVDFDTTGCLDLVGKLSFTELVVLVSQAPVLVSNDSAAVQIAGAFENWIGLISPWRLPEYVLPWRKESQFWRAASLQQQPQTVLQFVRSAMP